MGEKGRRREDEGGGVKGVCVLFNLHLIFAYIFETWARRNTSLDACAQFSFSWAGGIPYVLLLILRSDVYPLHIPEDLKSKVKPGSEIPAPFFNPGPRVRFP